MRLPACLSDEPPKISCRLNAGLMKASQDRASEFQAKARLAQQRASAWYLRARNALTNNETREHAA